MSEDVTRPKHPSDLPSWADEETTVRLDARSVRGLAHPVRVKMLGILRSDGPATATTRAAKLGLNTGATSYHLRQLATYGFIVEDADRGTTRERWWRAAHRVTRVDKAELAGDTSGEAYLRALGGILADKIQRAIDDHTTLPREWRDASTLSDVMLRLTAAELKQLKLELWDVLGRYRRHDPDNPDAGPTGSAPVTVQLQAFPFPGSVGP